MTGGAQSMRIEEPDLGIALKQRKESSAIRLDGLIDIASAAELKAILLDALKRGKAVRVALQTNVDLDVTAVQLLWAAEREARASGVGFALASPVPEPILSVLKEAGFEKFPIPIGGGSSVAGKQNINP
jgi:anti-anti-sigma regulatory factor